MRDEEKRNEEKTSENTGGVISAPIIAYSSSIRFRLRYWYVRINTNCCIPGVRVVDSLQVTIKTNLLAELKHLLEPRTLPHDLPSPFFSSTFGASAVAPPPGIAKTKTKEVLEFRQQL